MVDPKNQVLDLGGAVAEADNDLDNRELDELNREVIARGGQI